MKKLLLTIFGCLLSCQLAYGGVISYDALVTQDDLTISWLNTNFNTVVDSINSPDGALIKAGTISSDSLTDNGNPVKRWNDAFNSFVITGLLPPTATGLASITTAGRALIDGYYVQKDATSHTYTASKDTYVDISSTGVYTYSAVSVGSSEPSTTANSIRLAKVVTDATDVTEVEDKRVTSIDVGNKDDRTILGMNLIAVSPDCYYSGLVTVDAGVYYVGGTRLDKTAQTTLKIGAGASWWDGTADGAADAWWYIAGDSDGNVKLIGANPPDYCDASGNTGGDQKFYWYDTTVPEYWRVIGVFRTTLQKVSGDFLNYGNTYYYYTPQTFNKASNSTLVEVDLTDFVPEVSISCDAYISVHASSAAAVRAYFMPASPLLGAADALLIPTIGVFLDNNAPYVATVGWVPIVGGANSNRAIRVRNDAALDSMISGFRINTR